MKQTRKTFPALISTIGLLLFPLSTSRAFDFQDLTAIGTAYATHLVFHEMGHQVVAQEVGATNSKVSFLTSRDGNFYLGLSTYSDIPKKSILPYAVGGERMAGFTFDYALESYRQQPTTYNKALMFFSCTDFLVYTLLSNYTNYASGMNDPEIIRDETGCSKELLLSLVLGKSLINAYRVMNPEARFSPVVWVDDDSAALMLRFPF